MVSRPSSPDRRSTGFLLVFALANAGGVIAYLPLLTLLLPIKIELVAGADRITLFTATVIAGAAAASLSNILFGWLSDRSVARGGGRRRWVAIGVAATALAYAGIAVADTPPTIVLAVIAFQVAVNALLAPLMAIMADEIPDAQKGVAGGLLSLANPVASAVSAVLVGMSLLGEPGRLAIAVAACAACLVPLLLTSARFAADAPGVAEAPMLRGDLAIAWAARLLVQVAGNVLSLYLLYYFESVSPGEAPLALAGQVGHLLTIAYIVPLPIAVLAGRLSDRIGRRKPVLLAAAIVAAAGLMAMAWAGDAMAGAIGFGLYAVGSAVFLSLHSAFAMQLLPSATHRGRDLGLLNLANTLPALAGPALTWLLATPQDFGPALLALAGLSLCGGATILAVRGRR